MRRRRRSTKRRPITRSLAKIRAFAAINLVRRGKAKSLNAAARAERTTVKTIRRLLPAALIRERRGGRIRIKAGDSYSARVEILTDLGPLDVIARGSRERDLAGRHRATCFRVLGNKEPSSALHQFRSAKVGGHELISDPNRLFALARQLDLDQLDSLYVTPGS